MDKIKTGKVLSVFGWIFFGLVLYLFLVIFNIVPDEFGIKEVIGRWTF